MIGLEWPKPGIAFRHRTFSDFSTFQTVAVAAPLAIPSALAPRNQGQFVCAPAGNAIASKVNRAVERCTGIKQS